MRVTKTLCTVLAFALGASACGNDDGGETVTGGGDEPAVATADQWSAIPPGPLEGWEPNIVVGAAPGSTSAYVLGAYRLVEGDGYEVRSSVHRYDVASGEWSDLAAPPLNENLGRGSAVATETTLYLIAQDCGAGGFPDSGFSGCLSQEDAVHLRGLRYDLSTDAWAEWPLPEVFANVPVEDGSPKGVPRAVPGTASTTGVVYFVLDELTFGFDTATNTWTQLPVNLAGPCSDGELVYGFDRAALTEAITTLAPTAQTVPLRVPFVGVSPSSPPDSVDVTISYPQHLFGAGELTGVGAIQSACTQAGQLITMNDPGENSASGPWLSRSAGSSTFREVPLDVPELDEQVGFAPLSTRDAAFVVAPFRESEGDTLPILRFDPATTAFRALPRLHTVAGSYRFAAVGVHSLLATPSGPMSTGNSMAVLLVDE